MRCIVSGGTGFIGRRIVTRLKEAGHDVAIWSRKPAHAGNRYVWDPLIGEPPVESLDGMDAIIHLAGEPVAQRWNTEVKRRIADSRVLGTRRLMDAAGRVQSKPKVLLSASAVGYYGERGEEILTEASPPGTGFLADVCRGWEAEAGRAAELGIRVLSLRIGFVLGKDGGALAQMAPAFKAMVGGRLGSGKQWMPWIHVDDVAELFLGALSSDAAGVWNATSPNPVRNEEFTRELAAALHRPAVLPVPKTALKLVFGELGEHMLDSARVIPDAPLKAGHRFRYRDLAGALRQLFAH